MKNPLLILLFLSTSVLTGCSSEQVTQSAEQQLKYPVQTAYEERGGLRWTPEYKIRPSESARLTPADFPAPDGIVYPDFSRAGLKGPFTYPQTVIDVDSLGARADDETDDTAAIEKAVARAAQTGGAIIRFGPGTYLLSRPILITTDSTVIQGAGRDATTIKFAYDLPKETVRFFRPAPGETLTRASVIEVHSNPYRLKKHQLFINDRLIFERGSDTSGGERFSLVTTGTSIPSNIPKGKVTLRAVVERFDGTRTEETLNVEYDPSLKTKLGSTRLTHNVGAFMFYGDLTTDKRNSVQLAKPARRGDTELELSSWHEFKAGDLVMLSAKTDEAWLKKTASARLDFDPVVMLEIAGTEGSKLQLVSPLRMDFPGHATAYRVYPIRNCAVESLTLEQTQKQWIDAILFNAADNCRVQDVRIARCGRNPIVLGKSIHCEIRNSEFGRPFFSGGGGAGYLGFSSTWDSLIDQIQADGLRHAPAIQAWSSGNVIRRSVLKSSDANYHMLWAHENLIEQCVIDAARGTGSYGYGIFAQKPEVSIHGPGGGPRNVVYNSRIVSPRSGVLLGGSNENWIFAHNSFDVGEGPGMLFRQHSFDHIVWNNTMLIRDGSPAFQLEDADCIGIEIVGNQVAGTDTLFAGTIEPQVVLDNVLTAKNNIIAPKPDIPSIFEWQREQTRCSQQTGK